MLRKAATFIQLVRVTAVVRGICWLILTHSLVVNDDLIMRWWRRDVTRLGSVTPGPRVLKWFQCERRLPPSGSEVCLSVIQPMQCTHWSIWSGFVGGVHYAVNFFFFKKQSISFTIIVSLLEVPLMLKKKKKTGAIWRFHQWDTDQCMVCTIVSKWSYLYHSYVTLAVWPMEAKSTWTWQKSKYHRVDSAAGRSLSLSFLHTTACWAYPRLLQEFCKPSKACQQYPPPPSQQRLLH